MNKKSKGFTLVEVMLAVSLSTIVIFGTFAIFQAGNEQAQLGQVKMTLEDSLREGLYKMVQELRQSAPSRVTIGAGGTSIQFEVPDPANLIDASYSVNWDAAHSITYSIGGLNNHQLIRTDNTSNQVSVLANDITTVQFTGNNAEPTVVTITLSAQRTLTSGKVIPATPLQLTAQAEVRNP